MSEQATTIGVYVKIATIMGAIGAVKKDARNSHQNYAYTSAEQIYTALRGIMSEHSLICIPAITAVKSDDLNYIIDYTFTLIDAGDGSQLASTWTQTVPKMAKSSGGNYVDDKAVGKATTYAHRYFLMKLFMISSEDDPDLDKSDESKGKKRAASPKPSVSPEHPTTVDKRKVDGTPIDADKPNWFTNSADANTEWFNVLVSKHDTTTEALLAQLNVADLSEVGELYLSRTEVEKTLPLPTAYGSANSKKAHPLAVAEDKPTTGRQYTTRGQLIDPDKYQGAYGARDLIEFARSGAQVNLLKITGHAQGFDRPGNRCWECWYVDDFSTTPVRVIAYAEIIDALQDGHPIFRDHWLGHRYEFPDGDRPLVQLGIYHNTHSGADNPKIAKVLIANVPVHDANQAMPKADTTSGAYKPATTH